MLTELKRTLTSAFVPKLDPTDHDCSKSLVMNAQFIPTWFYVSRGYDTHQNILNSHMHSGCNT